MKIYLDYNATAPIRPQAAAKMQEVLSLPCNPSSVHGFGRAAKKHLEDSRQVIAEAISAWPNEIIFTASGTEANATALNSFPERKIFACASEHSSILKTVEKLGGETLPVDGNGILKLEPLQEKLANCEKPALVSVMLANNETGIIQPIAEIAGICRKYSALLHCDAVQALGKIPVDFSLLGADMLTISAHKMGGAVGAAALVAKNNIPLKPLIIGGGQELGRRAGTENVAAICAFAAATSEINLGFMAKLRASFAAAEEKISAAGGIIIGRNSPRLPNTMCVSMPGMDNQIQLMNFDLGGFAVSAGSACSSGRIETSHVLLAMGIAKEIASCTIRISGGWNTTPQEIEKFTEKWITQYSSRKNS